MTGLTDSLAILRHAMVATLPALLGLMVAACATVNAPAPAEKISAASSPDFRQHVEDVFRFQNQVASDVITHYELSDDPSIQPSDALLAAQARMQQNCACLNRVVTMVIDGKKPDLALKIKLMNTVDSCDVAAHEVASLFYGDSKAVVMKVSAPR